MAAKTSSPSVPKAVTDCREWLLWIIPQLDKLPRVRRYTLGEKLENRMLAILGGPMAVSNVPPAIS